VRDSTLRVLTSSPLAPPAFFIACLPSSRNESREHQGFTNHTCRSEKPDCDIPFESPPTEACFGVAVYHRGTSPEKRVNPRHFVLVAKPGPVVWGGASGFGPTRRDAAEAVARSGNPEIRPPFPRHWPLDLKTSKMPQRVADFFRSSTHTIEHKVSNLAKNSTASASRGRPSADRAAKGSRGSGRASSLNHADDLDDTPVPPYQQHRRMSSSRTNSFSSDPPKEHGQHHHHRISFPGLHFGRSSKDTHSSSPATLDWRLESPPLVMYGDPESSTGALLSGQLFLNVREDGLEVESLNATLNIHVTQKRPFANHCADCTSQHTEVKRWAMLQNPLAMAKGKCSSCSLPGLQLFAVVFGRPSKADELVAGEHSFPFSVLLEGHLPASMDNPLVSISYEFKAEAVPRSKGNAAHAPIRLDKVLDVKRSLATSETPHHSVRVFPPTNIKASAHYPQVIHPIGNYTLALRLDGIAKLNSKLNTIEYWKVKKMMWKLEETTKTIAPACERHSPKVGESAGEQQNKKGVIRSETRIIAEKELSSGWKSNYTSSTDSTVEVELEYSLAKGAKYACDSKSRDGTEVTHQLLVEMVVAQECAPANKPSLVTHTGVGRILRMHLGTTLTERGGIGISWDNEAPPIYQDVPPSPPGYCQETVFLTEGSISDVLEPLDATPEGELPRGSTDSAVHHPSESGPR